MDNGVFRHSCIVRINKKTARGKTPPEMGTAMERKHQTVGLIGLGFMGQAFARRLRNAGFDVAGTDVNPAQVAALSALGGIAASSAAEVVQACDLIVVAVYDAAQATSVLENVASVARTNSSQGKLLICTTTCLPDEMSEIDARAKSLGVAMLECPISGTSEQVLAGKGVALVAGEGNAVARADEVLGVLCPSRFIIGPNAGDAARAKLAVNLVLQLNRAALAEGLVLAERLGLDTKAFLDVLRGSAASSQVMATKGEKMVTSDFRPESRIAQTLKDAHLIIEAGWDAGLHLPLMGVNADLLAQSIDRGGPDRDSSAVIDAIRHYRTPDTGDRT